MLAPAIDLNVLTILPLNTIVVVINQVRSISALREQISAYENKLFFNDMMFVLY